MKPYIVGIKNKNDKDMAFVAIEKAARADGLRKLVAKGSENYTFRSGNSVTRCWAWYDNPTD